MKLRIHLPCLPNLANSPERKHSANYKLTMMKHDDGLWGSLQSDVGNGNDWKVGRKKCFRRSTSGRNNVTFVGSDGQSPRQEKSIEVRQVITISGGKQILQKVLFVPCSQLLVFCSPPDRKGLLDFMLESAFAMLLHHAPTQYPARAARQSAKYPARAARQWIPPSIPPELLASGSRPVSRQSCSPVDPAEYPTRAAHQWIPPSIPPERLASGSCRVSRQSGSPVDPAEYSAEYPRVARQWIPLSIPPEHLATGSRRVSHQSSPPVNPAEYPAEYPLPVDPAEYPASIEPERFASIRQ